MDRHKLSCSMEVCRIKWCVWPPLAATIASHLRRIEPINRWIKSCWILFHSCTSASRNSCNGSGGFWRWRTRLRVHSINVSLVTDPVIMPAKEKHGCDSGSESFDIHKLCDICNLRRNGLGDAFHYLFTCNAQI